jgi:hypothetical protein
VPLLQLKDMLGVGLIGSGGVMDAPTFLGILDEATASALEVAAEKAAEQALAADAAARTAALHRRSSADSWNSDDSSG